MPFPSAGCQTCKIRRVKCDETRPVCQRCRKSQRTCHGMGSGKASSIVHSENSYASGRKKRPRGPRSTQTVEVIKSLGTIPSHPLVDLKTQAMMYYLHFHMETLDDVPDVLKGLSHDCLPIWMSKAESPILNLAVSSIALAVFSRTHRHPPAAKQAAIQYQQLLQTSRSAISSLDEKNVDACLVAVFCMTRYENAIYQPSNTERNIEFASTMQEFSHHDGALAILKIWKEHLSHRYPPTGVIKHTRGGMLRSALMRNLALPEWIVDGAAFGERGLELEYDRILVRIINVRHHLYKLLDESTNEQRGSHTLDWIAEQLSDEAQDVEEALQSWASQLPSSWRHQRHTLPNLYPCPTKDFYSPTLFTYSSVLNAAVWNHYYTMRMLINSTRMRILELRHSVANDSVDEQRLDCIASIKLMADNLASSLPFCLHKITVDKSHRSLSDGDTITLIANGDLKPYVINLVIWPLSIAASLEGVEITQSLWFRSELARLGRMLGSGLFECAEADQWLRI